MLKKLERAIICRESLDMMYLANDGIITKRRVDVLQIGEKNFRAFCYLRNSKRTFVIDNVLALFPVIEREKVVF